MKLRPLVLSALALVTATTAEAQMAVPDEVSVDAFLRAELNLPPGLLDNEPVALPTSLPRCDSLVGRLRYGCEPISTSLGLVASTTIAVLSWSAFAHAIGNDAPPRPADAVGEAFTYGFLLPVALGSTALAGYSGYRLVVLIRSP